MFKWFIGSLLLLLFAPGILFAQKDTTQIIPIDEVIIHENRIRIPLSQKPSGLIVIDSLTNYRYANQSIIDILSDVAGVDVRQRASNGIQSDVGIRGSSFDQVLVLINGIKISDPQTGHHSFNLPVDIEDVERIEIYKGPSARVFGQNAFAGAINIITKAPSDKYVRLQVVGGDFGLAGGTISTSVPGKKMNNYFSVSHDLSSGYKYNTDYKITNVFYQSEINTSHGKIGLLSGFSSRKFGANGFYSSADFQDQYENIQTSLVAIDFKPDIRNRMLKLSNRVYWRRNSDEYLFLRYDPSYYRNLHVTNIAGLDVNLSWQSKFGVTGIGIDMNIPWITSNRLGDRNRYEGTVFVDQRITFLNGKLSLSPGIQINIFSGFKNNILPGIDIGYSVNPSLLAFFNSGYTFRVPTYTDLYYEDPGNSSNPELQPEYAFSNEMGVKTVNINGLTLQASYFFRKNFNLIDRVKDTANDKWKPENIGEVKMNGLDINLNIMPAKLLSNSNLFIKRFDIGYTFIQSEIARDISAISIFSLENLRNQLAIGAEFQYFKHFYHSLNLKYNDRVNMTDYTLVNTRLGWQNRHLNIYFDVTNAFNVTYKETSFATLPGRWIKIGLSYKLNLK